MTQAISWFKNKNLCEKSESRNQKFVSNGNNDTLGILEDEDSQLNHTQLPIQSLNTTT